MFWVHSRSRVDLKCIVAGLSIFKQAVHWVEHLTGEKKEPFTGKTTIVDSLFPMKHNIWLSPQVF